MQVPFPSWNYEPIYLPESLKVDIGKAPINEPMWFFMSFASRPDKTIGDGRQPLDHPKGFNEITSLQLTLPNSQEYSEPARCAGNVNGFGIVGGSEHLLKIGFDNEQTGQLRDFRPILPLIFRW